MNYKVKKMNKDAIVADKIYKTINHKEIIKGISMSIPQHTITLIQGHNGTGKSITLKMIAQLLKPSTGSINVNGTVSYVPDSFPPYLNLTIAEYIKYLIHTYNLNKNNSFLNTALDKFQLTPFLNQKIKDCSKGTQQKINILQCLLAEADIYILDEPFSGLDDSSLNYLIHILNKLKRTATIILTSHEAHIHNNIITHIYNIETNQLTKLSDKQYHYKIITVQASDELKFKQFYSEIAQQFKLTKLENDKDDTFNIKIEDKQTNAILLELIKADFPIKKVKEGSDI